MQAVSSIPYYWGPCIRSLELSKEEQDFYEEGSIIAWSQFNSSTMGDKPDPDFSNRNTYFHIWSSTGRDIAQFSNFPRENEILLLPCSVFLVVKKTTTWFKSRVHIYLRQVDIGLSKNTILWVDDHVELNTYENKVIRESSSTNKLGMNNVLIQKLSTDQALSFLKSPLAKGLKNNPRFRIITDMNREKDAGGQYAGASFLSALREKGFHNRVMISTANRVNAEFAVKNICKDQAGDYVVYVDMEDVDKFIREVQA